MGSDIGGGGVWRGVIGGGGGDCTAGFCQS